MRRRLLLACIAALAAAGFAVPAAHASGQACVELQINVNGTPVGVPLTCVDVPEAPPLPA